MNVKGNAEKIQARIEEACKRCGRNPDDIKVIAVTKYVSVERAQQALEAGIMHLGENRDQGFLDKYEAIGKEANWHFIGSLQSRKVKNVIDKVDYIHSLDRKSLAKEINKRAEDKVKCFVQVNTSGEDSKHGISPEEVLPFIESIADYSNVEVIGLMTMAPFTEEEDVLRETFRRLKQLQDDVQAKAYANAPCSELSMGMSNDFEIAIEEGATFIRIGTALVGKEF
ncbi:YggS family pyridoxal phosphate-dependent enzyme [Bacillus tianshenii]|nr:YggS family pyridoxal phosphate-dependent enzyme [Bacillus tianshenii]